MLANRLAGHEPEAAFRFLDEISRIPRGSGNEAAIAAWLMRFARERGIWAFEDEIHNVVIKRPGSPGCEGLEPVVLQGHTDMVCEKNAGTAHNFLTDPIEFAIDGDLLRARGTTLGADNGVAVAAMLSLLDNAALASPPLECVFTVMEEAGLDGAARLDPALIEGRRMINIDGGPEGHFLAGSAGGVNLTARIAAERTLAEGIALRVTVRGLRGGHSGADIHLGHANSLKAIGRLLFRLLRERLPFRLVSVSGGMKTNAIPREADAVLVLGAAYEQNARRMLEETAREILAEIASKEPDAQIRVGEAAPQKAMSSAATRKAILLLSLLPDGVQEMGEGGVPALSLNTGAADSEGGAFTVTWSIRSGTDSRLEALCQRLEAAAALIGAETERSGRYPAWEYRAKSPLRDEMRAVFQELYGREAVVETIHAGLECGIFAGKLPGADIVVIGPDMGGLHTPEEWLSLSSFGRMVRFLEAVLQALTRPQNSDQR